MTEQSQPPRRDDEGEGACANQVTPNRLHRVPRCHSLPHERAATQPNPDVPVVECHDEPPPLMRLADAEDVLPVRPAEHEAFVGSVEHGYTGVGEITGGFFSVMPAAASGTFAAAATFLIVATFLLCSPNNVLSDHLA